MCVIIFYKLTGIMKVSKDVLVEWGSRKGPRRHVIRKQERELFGRRKGTS